MEEKLECDQVWSLLRSPLITFCDLLQLSTFQCWKIKIF